MEFGEIQYQFEWKGGWGLCVFRNCFNVFRGSPISASVIIASETYKFQWFAIINYSHSVGFHAIYMRTSADSNCQTTVAYIISQRQHPFEFGE